MPKGIEVRHKNNCPSHSGGRCNCEVVYRASVWSKRDQKPIREQFSSLAAAENWRTNQIEALRHNDIASVTTKISTLAEEWLQGAKSGTIPNRSGDKYKPSVLRGYEQALRQRIVPKLGDYKVSDLYQPDIQRFADSLQAEGLDPSTIRNQLMPLRSIYRRAISNGQATFNPVDGVSLPAVRGRRDRIASPAEAKELIAALQKRDQAIWATAMYAGLRLGELLALQWENINLQKNTIKIEQSWDPKEGAIEPKSLAGVRKTPLVPALKRHLVEHGTRSTGFVFTGRSPDRPVSPKSVNDRAYEAWEEAGLEPITLHEARHTFASLMIAAGVPAKDIATYMGHSSIYITLDRYGHLMPGNEAEAADKLDKYLNDSDKDSDKDPGKDSDEEA